MTMTKRRKRKSNSISREREREYHALLSCCRCCSKNEVSDGAIRFRTADDDDSDCGLSRFGLSLSLSVFVCVGWRAGGARPSAHHR